MAFLGGASLSTLDPHALGFIGLSVFLVFLVLFCFNYLFIYLAAPGLSCGMRDLVP